MVGGALRGAALGGAAGGLGRTFRDARLLNPSLSTGGAVAATAGRVGTGIANFAKRQVHGVTGHMDADAIGMAGNAASASKVKLLNARVMDEARAAPGKAKQLLADHAGAVKSELASGARSQKLQDAGITSLRGIASAMRDPARRSGALRAMGSTVTSGGGPGGAALAIGAPVALSAPSLARGDESATGGLTVGQKVKGLGAGIAAGAAVGGLPVIPQMLAGGVLDSAARRALKPKGRSAVPQE